MDPIETPDEEAAGYLRAALTVLRDAQSAVPPGRPTRERAIAITHLEDALLRLLHGSPADLP